MSWRGTLRAACWDADEAAAIIPVEAESTSDGIFLATHSSIPITLRDQVGSAASGMSGGTVVDEHTLLRAVYEQPADQPIIPILGKSGTGKSHLVRWLRVNLSTQESTRMIFVPKHRMSLRGILELILAHATGERAEELRTKVSTAIEGFANESEAQLRLLFTLSVLVETRGAMKDGTAEETELRDYLAGSTGLPALLGDQIFRARWLHETGPIARLVREKLSGKGTDDKEDAYGFSADDLKLSVDDVTRAGAAAREIAAVLTSDPQLRALAASMLNDQLAPAVSEVFGIGGDDLKNLLDELRLELRRQGLELLVLIEDFSIFQGIQGGLIDAITMIPTEDHDVCAMRVVMAVTTGYFMNQMPDTVFTRTYKAFDLEVSDVHKTGFDPARFATQYLNAVRIGSSPLDEAHASKSPIPNACEQCPVNDSCHEAFGAVDGHGLFPFNRAALDRAIQSQSVDGEFVARDVLTRVLRPVLHRDRTEIDAGRFPSAAFAAEFAAGARGILSNVEDTIQLTTKDADETERRIRLVKFWGGGSPQNLAPTIHQAFEIPVMPGLGSGVGFGSEVPAGPTRTPAPAPAPHLVQPAPREVPALVLAVDNWRETGELIQGDRNRLRSIVHSAVSAYLDLDDGYSGDTWWTNGKKHLLPAFEAISGVVLDDSKLVGALLPLNRKDDTTVRVLRAMAWLDAVEDWTTIDKGDELQRLCDRQVRSWAALVSEKLMPTRDRRDDPELARLAHALLAISKALGVPEAFKTDGYNRSKALFANAPTPRESKARPLLRKWQEVLTTEGSQRIGREGLQQRLLRLASYSQGVGKPLGLELNRLTRAIRDGASDNPWPRDTPALVSESCAAIADRVQAVDELRAEALALLPDTSDVGDEIARASAAMNTLMTELSMAGLLPNAVDQAALVAAGKAVKVSDQRTVEKVLADLSRWSDLSSDERLMVLTADWDAAAAAVRAWLQPTMQTLDLLEQRLPSSPASDAHRDYDQVRVDLAETLTDLAAGIADIGGPEEVA
jgi:hypothetical protein